MYIASKFEEIFPPEIADFTYITDDTYTKTQTVRMERLILKTLDFNLAAPTTHTFLLRYLNASEVDLSPSKPKSNHEVSGSSPSHSQAISQTITFLSKVKTVFLFSLELLCMSMPPSICASWRFKMLIPTLSISPRL